MLRARVRWCCKVAEGGEVFRLICCPCLHRCRSSLAVLSDESTRGPHRVLRWVSVRGDDVSDNLCHRGFHHAAALTLWARRLPDQLSVAIFDSKHVSPGHRVTLARECAVGGEHVNVARFKGTDRDGGACVVVVAEELKDPVAHVVPDTIGSSAECRLDRWNVQRSLQRMTHANGTTLKVVPFSRRPPFSKVNWDVHKEGGRCDRTLLKRVAIDDRLDRGAWLSICLEHVVLGLEGWRGRFGVVVCRAGVGQDVARARIHGCDCRVVNV